MFERRARFAFPASVRLRKRRDFLAVQGRGDKRHLQYFLVLFVRGDARKAARIGITVTKKVGNAVLRNRIKRRVRECFRHAQSRFEPGVDMVWIAKQSAAGVTTAQVRAEFEQLLDKLPQLARTCAPGAET